uniref:PX domain-containing protein n=1 Tax=Hyaloperonospora arabidopsidis (strain Emoy2) TaxID=559515 RepID=M4BKJ2_HYAAE
MRPTIKRERTLTAALPPRPLSRRSTVAASRDLQITGVTRRNTSWQYHIEVLDVRACSFRSGTSTASGLDLRLQSRRNTDPEAADRESSQGYPELPPMVRYTVMRRYTDFRRLYNYLVETHGLALRDALPKFPDGGWISYLRGDDPRLLYHRRKRLERFLRAVDTRPELQWSAAFRAFLRPDLDDLATMATSSPLPVPVLLTSNLTTIAASSGCSNSDMDTRPPPPLSAPLSLPARVGLVESSNVSTAPPVSASGGYVSLSQVRSPEIRFRKKIIPGGAHPRGDLKRRRLHLYSHDADDMDVDVRKSSAKKQLAMALSGALGFKRFVVGVGSGVIGTFGRMGSDRSDSVDTAEYQDDSDTDEERGSSGSVRDRNADLIKMLSSGGS